MNALMLDNYDVVEMDAGVMGETDGGYGYYPGMEKDAAAANKTLGTLWNEWCAEYNKGYQRARAGNPL